ncbi:dTMP kinase, partial [Bifidobacteriaceae bacterium NR015]
FARRTREAFLDLAQESADRYRVLDATFSAKSLSELIVQDVHNLIEEIETK